MNTQSLDHFVLTTANLDACLAFYTGLLGLRAEKVNGRYALCFGTQKINIHTKPAEFLPAAAYPLAGSLDLCFSAEGDADVALKAFREKNAPLVSDVVERHGARGAMKSIYLRDPDGNLVELGFYGER
ncbi:MAG: VOC family protein [Schwartzia sp.]|nr:VOC family protein [Schwartzia sp. (in: firmicutes)]